MRPKEGSKERADMISRMKEVHLPDGAFIHKITSSTLMVAVKPNRVDQAGVLHDYWNLILSMLRPHGVEKVVNIMSFVSNHDIPAPLRLRQAMMIEAKR